MTEILLVLILADVVPIGLWMYYFNDKNPRTQPLKEVLSIFFLGIFSIFPVVVFHRYVNTIILQQIESWHPFLSEPFILGGLQLLLILLFVIMFVILFSFINALVVKKKYQLPLSETFESTKKKLYNLTPLILFLVLFLVIEMGSIFALNQSFIVGLAGSTMLFAMLEEYFKYIINPFLAYKRINSVGNAMVNALYVGLAFAFVENALFFAVNYLRDDFVFIFIYRSLFTTLLHVCASGIIGYFYGLSLFSKSMLTNYEIEKGQYQVPGWLQKIFKWNKNKTFQSASVTQGFVIAALVHALFNLLLSLDYKIISAILVIGLTAIIISLLVNKFTQVQYGLIGSAAMPNEDFEKLRLQISVLQHVKDIQLNRIGSPKQPVLPAAQNGPPVKQATNANPVNPSTKPQNTPPPQVPENDPPSSANIPPAQPVDQQASRKSEE